MTTSTPGGRVTPPGGQRTAPWGKWSISERDAQAMVAEARKAFFVMAGILVVLWIIQIIGAANMSGSLLMLRGTIPLLHFSWAHIEGNSGPLFIFGFLAAYRGVKKFAAVTVLVIITSGLAAWLFEPANTVGAGASGVVFGYFGYIMVRGFFDRHLIDVLIGAIMALCFAYQFAVLLPHAGIGWQAHVGGLVGGVLAGWLFRDKRPRDTGTPVPATPVTRPVTGTAFPRPQVNLPRKPTSPG